MISLHRSLVLALAIAPVAVFGQGTLTPPGAPAPTMKTLSQVEPRIPVFSLPGDATSQYVISQSGSYYLTGNIEGVAGKRGIKITAKDVSLDLAGFTLHGSDATLDAITITPESGQVAIENGIIRHWGGAGIAGANVASVTVRRLTVSTAKGGPGIELGTFAQAENVITETTKVGGILLNTNSVARHCTVAGVVGIDTANDDVVCGIQANTVSDCSVRSIVGLISSVGVSGIGADTVQNCSVSYVAANGATNACGIGATVVRGCHVQVVDGAGDQTSGIAGVVVDDCFIVDITGSDSAGIRGIGYGLMAHHNRLVRCGIVSGPGASVLQNSIHLNAGAGTGVLVEYTSSVIDGNQINGGSIGIYVLGTNNRVVRNFVSNSTIKFNLAAGNQAPVAVVSADDITTASPWANFSQ